MEVCGAAVPESSVFSVYGWQHCLHWSPQHSLHLPFLQHSAQAFFWQQERLPAGAAEVSVASSGRRAAAKSSFMAG